MVGLRYKIRVVSRNRKARPASAVHPGAPPDPPPPQGLDFGRPGYLVFCYLMAVNGYGRLGFRHGSPFEDDGRLELHDLPNADQGRKDANQADG
jgi:hypothetical protein